jgi:hypothetical protein
MVAPTTELKDLSGHVRFDVLSEDTKHGRMSVRGIFQRVDTKNANGRIYTSSLWEKTLNDPKVNEALRGRRMLGEVEHPKDGATNLNRVSHIVTGLSRKGDEIIGEAEILNTPTGRVVQELFRSGVEVGISSRGRGTSQMRGGIEYVDETSFQLDTFDFVFKPSTPGAYPRLQESVLSESPYGNGSTMKDKLNEFKRLEVRAMDITSQCADTKLSSTEMQSWYSECIELEASADSLIATLTEDEAKEHDTQVTDVVEKITTAKAGVIACLDRFHENNDTDLDRRVTNARAGIVEDTSTETPESTSDSDSETNPKSESVLSGVQALLTEALDARDYYRSRLAESLEVLESDEDEMTRRYVAAKKLGEELLARLEVSESDLADLVQKHKALEGRYNAAVELVAGVAERQDRSRLVRKVREALEMHPELQKFHKFLMSCESMDELDQKLAEVREALDLPTQDKEEAMIGQVNITAAVEDGNVDEGTDDQEDVDSDDDETPMGENSELPSPGMSINESEDSEVLTTGAGSLLEHHEDRGVATAHRMLKQRSGWK